MLYPAMADLLKHIDSRYLLVNVIARRARQISIEAETEHIPLEDKPVTIAIHEVSREGMSRNKARAEVTLPASFAFFRRTVPATAA